jgi:hypothetical protein
MSSLSTDVLPLKKWCHLAVTSDGSLMRVYLDGFSSGSNSAQACRP